MTYSFRTNGDFIDLVHTDNTSINVETVLKSLHYNSRSVSWSFPQDTTKINFDIDGWGFSNISISEIDFDGDVMDAQEDFETGITEMFPGLAGGVEGGASYLVYSANLSQTGGGAPVPQVMENTIGAGVWTRIDVGDYLYTLAGVFTAEKTWCVISGGDGLTYKISRLGVNDVEVQTFNTSNAFADGSLIDVSIEIRIYP